MVNSSSPYTYGNYENPEYYGQTEAPQMTARDLLPGYASGVSPPPSIINKENPASTIANIIATQQAYGAANQDQRAFVKQLDNPSESAFHQGNLTKEPVILPGQRTASSISQAQEQFNEMQAKAENERDNPITLNDEFSHDHTYRFGPSPVDAPNVLDTLPTAKSILTGSTIGPEPKEPTPSFSAGTNKFRSDTANTLASLEQAKNAGLTSLDIFDSKGNKIGTTNPQDIVRARYDILSASLASGGPVSAKGASVLNGITTTQTDYERSNDNPLKAGLASLVEPGAYIGLSLADLPNVIGKTISGGNAYQIGQSEQQKIQQQIQKSIGTTYLDQIMQGNFNPTNESAASKVASLIGSGVGLYLTGGGGGARAAGAKIASSLKNIPEIISDLPKGIATNKGVVSKIASGIQEGSLISKVQPIETITGDVVKGSPLREFTQGTAGKSGIESFVPEKAPEYLARTGPEGAGKVETIKPELPPGIDLEKTITGIGPKGQAVPVKVSNEINLNPGAEGEAKTPYSVINPKGSTLLVRSEPNDILPPNKVLVEFQGMDPLEAAGRSVALSKEGAILEPVSGMKNTFIGPANARLIESLSNEMKAGRLKVGTDIFSFGSKEFAGAPDIYGQVTRNPSLFKSKAFGEGGAFEGITRPGVIRYFVGGVGNKARPARISPNQLINKRFRPFSSGDFSLKDIGEGKIGAGAAGRAMSLLKENAGLRNILTNVKLESNVGKTRYDYLGPILSPEQRRTGRRGGNLEYETIVYPNIVNISPLARSRINTSSGNKLLSNFGMDEINKMVQGSKSTGLGINISKMLNIGSRSRTDNRINEIVMPKIDTGLDVITGQTTSQITVPVNVPIQITTHGNQRLTGGGGLLTGFNFPWGYYLGNKKKRVNRFMPSFFTYSVNPNVVGAIAQAGLPGKISGPSLSSVGRFKGFSYKSLLRNISIGGGHSKRSSKLGGWDMGLDLDFGF